MNEITYKCEPKEFHTKSEEEEKEEMANEVSYVTLRLYKIIFRFKTTVFCYLSGSPHTVNRKIFVVKIFSDSMGSAKIKRTNIMRIINANVVRGRLSENYLTRKLITLNIFDTKYYRFTVVANIANGYNFLGIMVLSGWYYTCTFVNVFTIMKLYG